MPVSSQFPLTLPTRGPDGETLASLGSEEPKIYIPPEGVRIWNLFQRVRTRLFAACDKIRTIPSSELEAFVRLTGTRVNSKEMQVLMELDDAFVLKSQQTWEELCELYAGKKEAEKKALEMLGGN